MWFLVIAMLVILVLAGAVVLYVAFPHRGEDVPHVPWLGRLMQRGVETAPTLDNTAEDGVEYAHEPLGLRDLHDGSPETRGATPDPTPPDGWMRS